MQSIHVRSATRCLELARTNGGIYAKAAQFVASLQGGAGDKGIPKAYVDVLRVMTDAAPYHSFQEMDQVRSPSCRYQAAETNQSRPSGEAMPRVAAHRRQRRVRISPAQSKQASMQRGER